MMMRLVFALLLSLTFVISQVPMSLAKAYFASTDEMIRNCEIIAIVDISKVEAGVDDRGMARHYHKRAHATVEKVIKGTLPKTCTISGGEDFICAQVDPKPGRYLAFLNHDTNLLIGANWQHSLQAQPFDNLLKRVDELLPTKQELKSLAPPLNTLREAKNLEDDAQGERAGPSPVWQAYQQALKLPASELPDVEKLFLSATPAGRVYAAMVMRKMSKEKGQDALALLGRSNATLKYQSGCEVITVGLFQVGSDLWSNGKYMNLKVPD